MFPYTEIGEKLKEDFEFEPQRAVMSSGSDRIFHMEWDDHEREKMRVFSRLNEIARSRNIAVLYASDRMEDFLVEVWDNVIIQSNGPPDKPNTCVFCGKDVLTSENAYELGSLLVHGDCFHEFFIDGVGGCFLESNHYRPVVMIIRVNLEGAIDNAVLELACGVGIEFWFSQQPVAPHDWKRGEGESYRKKLVAQTAQEQRKTKEM